jgi:hypothetical protein
MKNKFETVKPTVLEITKICLQHLYPVLEVHVMHLLAHINNLYSNGHNEFLKLCSSVMSKE